MSQVLENPELGREIGLPNLALGIEMNTRDGRQVLRNLVRTFEGRREIAVLEVGSYEGSSALVWAHAIKDAGLTGSVLCVDAWEPYHDEGAHKGDQLKLVNEALASGRAFERFRQNTAGAPVPIRWIRGKSADVLLNLQIGKLAQFDIVYLDGDHSFEGLAEDLQVALPLVRAGGILCGDNFDSADYQGVIQAVQGFFGNRFEHEFGVWWTRIPSEEKAVP